MARYKENDCVGCSPCMGCGRRFGYTIYVCDQCGAETNDEDEIHEVNGFDICDKCYQKMVEDEEKEEQEQDAKRVLYMGLKQQEIAQNTVSVWSYGRVISQLK